jgi:hypothetical protein
VLGIEQRSTEENQPEPEHRADDRVETKPAFSSHGDDRHCAEHPHQAYGHEHDAETRDHRTAPTRSPLRRAVTRPRVACGHSARLPDTQLTPSRHRTLQCRSNRHPRGGALTESLRPDAPGRVKSAGLDPDEGAFGGCWRRERTPRKPDARCPQPHIRRVHATAISALNSDPGRFTSLRRCPLQGGEPSNAQPDGHAPVGIRTRGHSTSARSDVCRSGGVLLAGLDGDDVPSGFADAVDVDVAGEPITGTGGGLAGPRGDLHDSGQSLPGVGWWQPAPGPTPPRRRAAGGARRRMSRARRCRSGGRGRVRR